MSYDEAVETIETENFKGVIRYSDQPNDPLDDFEFGTLTTWHRDGYGTPHSWESRLYFWKSFLEDDEQETLADWYEARWEEQCAPFLYGSTSYLEANRALAEEYKAKLLDIVVDRVFYLTVFLYDHSGVTVSSSSFSCPWDSGELGYLWISAEEAFEKIADFGHGDLSREDQAEKINELLNLQLKVFDQWLQNDVYDVAVFERKRCGECDHVSHEIHDGISEIYGFEAAQAELAAMMAGCEGGENASR